MPPPHATQILLRHSTRLRPQEGNVSDSVRQIGTAKETAEESNLGCPACREGLTNRCKNSVFIGHGVHGGDAEFITVPSRYAFKIKDDVPLNEACIIPDAVSTPFHALKSRSVPVHIIQNASNPSKLFDRKTHWLNGKNVVVFGVGGVGGPTVNLAAKYIQAKNVVAVDVFDN